ncbi:MAG: ECF transporter S component [Christensenellaceae bacterium]|nr:ECF transporter S component [Christensenellaceae bacterium]
MDRKTNKLVLTALFAALICISTMVITIPSPMNGYVNLGDAFVLLAGWFMGPLYGMAAGGIGSALADMLLGYMHYVPGTFLIKAGMAVIASLFAKKKKRGMMVIGGALAEIFMVIGYFIYAAFVLGEGMAATASIPGNIMQGIFGLVMAILLNSAAEKSGFREKFL